MPEHGYTEYCNTHGMSERWCSKHGNWKVYWSRCGDWLSHNSLNKNHIKEGVIILISWVSPVCGLIFRIIDRFSND